MDENQELSPEELQDLEKYAPGPDEDPNNLVEEERPKKDPDFKMRRIEVHKTVAYIMMGCSAPKLPKFHKKFHVRVDHTGAHEYLEELDNQILKPISDTMIIDSISYYCAQMRHRTFDLKNSERKEIFNNWSQWSAAGQPLTAPISPVLQKSTKGYCWHRLDFDISEGPTPLFNELMTRATNATALQAWIGSLFDRRSDRQQYVWLYGDGGNGKGALTRFLQRALGYDEKNQITGCVANEQLPAKGREPNQFWTSGLLGKRLVVFGDNDNTDFPVSGFFKSLTGGDGTRIEKKGQQPFSVTLDCKFIFNSNKRPEIVNTPADKRRAIFCTFGPRATDYGKDYEELLWKEAPHIIQKCLMTYKEQTKESKSIPVDEDATIELIADNESAYQAFVDEFLAIDPGVDPEKACSAVEMQQAFKAAGIASNQAIKRYKDFMEREHQIAYSRVTENKKVTRRYYSNCRRKIYVSDRKTCIHCDKDPNKR